MKKKGGSMKTRALVISFLGVFFTGLVTTAAVSAAEVQKYSIGSGAMGGGWQIGVGAAVQMLTEQLKGKYFFTAAASGGSVENIRRMVTGEYQTVWVHTT